MPPSGSSSRAGANGSTRTTRGSEAAHARSGRCDSAGASGLLWRQTAASRPAHATPSGPIHTAAGHRRSDMPNHNFERERQATFRTVYADVDITYGGFFVKDCSTYAETVEVTDLDSANGTPNKVLVTVRTVGLWAASCRENVG